MQPQITTAMLPEHELATVKSILRRCVHCGLCNTQCPTFQLTGNELDSPRGRIYQIKTVLESNQASATQLFHLDRCLVCQSCETACPSGVEYAQLLEIGRRHVAQQCHRSLAARVKRWLALRILPYARRMRTTLFIAAMLTPLLPKKIRCMLPQREKPAQFKVLPVRPMRQRVILLEGCVQAAVDAVTHAHCRQLLEKIGIETIVLKRHCCGALPYHLEDLPRAYKIMRKNIDHVIPLLESGAAAVISTASGCGNTLKSYAKIFQHDPLYRHRAIQLSNACRDIAELLAGEASLPFTAKTSGKAVFHCPCTLQHGQRLPQAVADVLHRCNIALPAVANSHLCCGSAGYYSLAQPDIADRLRQQKLASLLVHDPDIILTANIGCQLHLQAATSIPVRHWITLLH